MIELLVDLANLSGQAILALILCGVVIGAFAGACLAGLRDED